MQISLRCGRDGECAEGGALEREGRAYLHVKRRAGPEQLRHHFEEPPREPGAGRSRAPRLDDRRQRGDPRGVGRCR